MSNDIRKDIVKYIQNRMTSYGDKIFSPENISTMYPNYKDFEIIDTLESLEDDGLVKNEYADNTIYIFTANRKILNEYSFKDSLRKTLKTAKDIKDLIK